MKLNTTQVKRKTGMTLLELTVVILVLLSLISILFIGARAWKKGSDRAANILNIRNVQQAVRAHANVRGLTEGFGLASSEILGSETDKYLKVPTPPISGQTYSYGSTVPAVGTLYITNPDLGTTAGSGEYWYSTDEASKYADW